MYFHLLFNRMLYYQLDMYSITPPQHCLLSSFTLEAPLVALLHRSSAAAPSPCSIFQRASIVSVLKAAVSNDKICMGMVVGLYLKVQINQIHMSHSASFSNIPTEVPRIEKVSVHPHIFCLRGFRRTSGGRFFSSSFNPLDSLKENNSTSRIFQW